MNVFGKARLGHLVIETNRFDDWRRFGRDAIGMHLDEARRDLTLAYQRVKQLGFGMALSIGQHTNDKELSFYAVTPSGFEWEVGWNPIIVDETTWEPTTHQGFSIWGHTPEEHTVVDILDRFKTAAQSTFQHEGTVPALVGVGIPDH